MAIAPAMEHGGIELGEMITYQLGWAGKDAGPEAEGKQIRPLLVLLAADAAGGNWQAALPAAAAVELIHNFSLIHDDIEDNSPLRRGRPTIWKLWGEAQAINTGDAMFALANLSLAKLEKTKIAQDKKLAKKILDKVQELENEGYQFEAADASFDLLVKKVMRTYKPAFKLENAQPHWPDPIAPSRFGPNLRAGADPTIRQALCAESLGPSPPRAARRKTRSRPAKFGPWMSNPSKWNGIDTAAEGPLKGRMPR